MLLLEDDSLHRSGKSWSDHWLIGLVGMEWIDGDEMLDSFEEIIGSEESEEGQGGVQPKHDEEASNGELVSG
jgi:hypothetical protein